jgi:hypothetical protein
VAAGLLANLVGALFVTVLGNGTIALMLKAAWLRSWLYHGPHLFFGVDGLRPVLGSDPGAIAYAHEITAAQDSGAFIAVCMVFLLITLAVTTFGAMIVLDGAGTEPGDPRRRGGGPQGTEPPSDPTGGVQLAPATGEDLGSAVGLLGPDQQGPRIGQDGVLVGTADSAVQSVGAR